MDGFDIDLDSAVLHDAAPEDEEAPKRTRKPRSDAGKPRGTRASSSKKLRDELLVPYATLAASLGMIAPTASGVLLQRGEKTVDALLSIAGDHPAMMKALKTASKMSPFSELAMTGVSVLVAVGLDFGRIPPEHPFAAMTGVTDLYMQLHPPTPEQAQQAPSGNGQMYPTMFPVPASGA